MASNRHLGRIVALQTLYEQEFRLGCGDTTFDIDEVLKRNIHRYRDTIDDQDFIVKLVKGVISEQDALDAVLQPVAPEWPIDQIARMDRLMLRLGLYELLHEPSVPPKVVINEAVELAKAFGGDNSSKFINGVLGTVLRKREEAEEPNDAKADAPAPTLEPTPAAATPTKAPKKKADK